MVKWAVLAASALGIAAEYGLDYYRTSKLKPNPPNLEEFIKDMDSKYDVDKMLPPIFPRTSTATIVDQSGMPDGSGEKPTMLRRTPQDRWMAIFEAAEEQERLCPKCKGSLDFAHAWHDYTHAKQGKTLNELHDPENFKRWLYTLKQVDIDESTGRIILPENQVQDQVKHDGKPCTDCEGKREKLLDMLNTLESKVRDAKTRLEGNREELPDGQGETDQEMDQELNEIDAIPSGT